jgi:hypothetical protein
MSRILSGIVLLALGTSAAAVADDGQASPPTPAEQYQTLFKEFHATAHGLYKARTDEERQKVAERMVKLSPRFLDLAQNYPADPIALDALIQVINAELWLENNTSHPGRDHSPQARAVAILLRDHLRSPKLAGACQRAGYGFSRDCETLLRTALEKSPHHDVQAMACLRLAQFLNGRLQRLDLLKDRPDMARRYERLFGKDYMAALRRRDRAEAEKDVEALFERAADQYRDVKATSGGTIGERAKSDLHELRHLSIGRPAQEIEGQDQHGQRLKLSDYRGKVVLLYFWSEY